MELIQDFGPSDPPGQAQTFGLTGAGSLNGGAKKRGRGSGGPKTLFANKINASQSPSSARPSPRPAAPAAKIPKKAARPAAPARPPAEARARDADCESQEAVLGLLDTLEEIDVARADDVDGGRRPGAFADEGFGPPPRASRPTKAGRQQRGPGARDSQIHLPAASPWLPRNEPGAQGARSARGARIVVTRGDVDRLEPDEFLNDNLVDLYVKVLVADAARSRLAAREGFDAARLGSEVHAFSSHFFTKLQEEGLRAPDGKDRAYDRHLHWSLAIVCHPGALVRVVRDRIAREEEEAEERARGEDDDESDAPARIDARAVGRAPPPAPCIIFMDSLKMHSAPKVERFLRAFLELEWAKRKPDEPELKLKLKVDLPLVVPKVPMQTNSCDCGVYVLRYAEEFLSRAVGAAPTVAVTEAAVDDKFAAHDGAAWFTAAGRGHARGDLKAAAGDLAVAASASAELSASDGADPLRGAAVASRAGGRPERREERPVDGRGLGHAEREVALGQGPAEERVVEGERVAGRDHRTQPASTASYWRFADGESPSGQGQNTAACMTAWRGAARRAGPAASRRAKGGAAAGDGGVAAERAGDAVADVDAAVAAAAVGGEERPRPVRVAARAAASALRPERAARAGHEPGPESCHARPGIG
ncbi:small ubiquitin-like modifier deconjugating peptidase [Aureococcus anophagefferens]|uniref:Small ubiquitin-like modifier deconjugating peptidase n=2 Tax=Aureococcus anophagefferens TaxID=44056 RepID=A0ABR1FV21_AURAN